MDTSVNVKIHGAFVVLGFLLFFPIGIVLLIIRYALHAKYNYLREKDYRLTGHVLLILFLLIMLIYLLSGTTGDQVAVGFIAFLILLGLPALIFYAVASSQKKKMDGLYKTYYGLVIEQGTGSIAVLSQSTGVSAHKAREDIRYMIVTGRLPHAIITDNGTIKLSGGTTNAGAPGNDFAGTQTAAPTSVVCSNCGATVNLYPGKPPECDFCRTVLNR